VGAIGKSSAAGDALSPSSPARNDFIFRRAISLSSPPGLRESPVAFEASNPFVRNAGDVF
jgi:hypothetical protein